MPFGFPPEPRSDETGFIIVKKQQMNWTLRGANLLSQTRTKVLNNELEKVFRQWYPQFHSKAA